MGTQCLPVDLEDHVGSFRIIEVARKVVQPGRRASVGRATFATTGCGAMRRRSDPSWA
jgi:hypothetical protein